MRANAETSDNRGNYAAVNGLEMYYEMHGTGQPLVLLPGGFGTADSWGELLPRLAQDRQVIAVELQGHGHTANTDRPLSFELMADDIAALIAHLGLASADILGYSLGGGVALQTAIRHPHVVRKLVIMSAACRSDGWYPADRAGMAAVNGEAALQWVGSPMHQAYARVAPHPEDWPRLADRLGQLLRQDYDWTEATAHIQAPALIVIGDADGVRPEHAVELFRLLGGDQAQGGLDSAPRSRLAVLPGTTHLDMLSHDDLLAAIIPPFLDAPLP